MKEYKRLTMTATKSKPYDIYMRLAELEDAIESGEFVRLPCIQEKTLGKEPPNPTMYKIVYRDKFGFITTEFCADKAQAEAKLTEITNGKRS